MIHDHVVCFFKVDWSQYIAVNSATAHPHYDTEGATYNMGNSYGKGGKLPCTLHTFNTAISAHPLAKRCNCVCRWADSGFFYNIIRVPPLDAHSAKKDAADLTGAEVICSIPADEPRKPSYYHSFGKMLCARRGLHVFRHGTLELHERPDFFSFFFYWPLRSLDVKYYFKDKVSHFFCTY